MALSTVMSDARSASAVFGLISGRAVVRLVIAASDGSCDPVPVTSRRGPALIGTRRSRPPAWRDRTGPALAGADVSRRQMLAALGVTPMVATSAIAGAQRGAPSADTGYRSYPRSAGVHAGTDLPRRVLLRERGPVRTIDVAQGARRDRRGGVTAPAAGAVLRRGARRMAGPALPAHVAGTDGVRLRPRQLQGARYAPAIRARAGGSRTTASGSC